jgi:outer membrane lipoprotein SlyB
MEGCGFRTDVGSVDRKLVALCVLVGSTIGGYVATFFGQGSFSLASIVGTAAGGIAGVLAAARIDASL